MANTFSLDHKFLRNSHPRYSGPHLHELAQSGKVSTSTITQELLQAVAIESLPPRVYAIWLCACPDETAVAQGIRQTHSVLVRTAAIRTFGRWFRTARCLDIWRAVGGTKGIVALLAGFSVSHVRLFAKHVGRCATSLAVTEERQQAVTELMYALASRFFPDATMQNPDHRPLLEYYAILVYACTPEAQDAWSATKSLPTLDMATLAQANPEHYQKQCLEKAAAGSADLWKYNSLFTTFPKGPVDEDPTVPKSMAFAATVLETLVQHGIHIEKQRHQGRLGAALMTMLHRIAHRNVKHSFALRMVTLISKCAVHHIVAETNSFNVDYQGFLVDIATIWERDPDTYEPLLSGLLQTEGVNASVNIANKLNVLSSVRLPLRYRLFGWTMLRQHKVDIETVSQLSAIRAVPWEFFTLLPKHESRLLLERFVTAKGEEETWIRETQIPRPKPTYGIPALDALRCRLQEDDATRFSEAERKTKEYQRFAQEERDGHQRIGWLTASTALAIVSGSLELLHENLLWARRFNRDPLVHEFYDSYLFADADTHSLLAGIPEHPSKATGRSAVTSSIQKGNNIALLLLETASMCQNEPFFQSYHWTKVQCLFVGIVQARFRLTNRFQSVLELSDDQMYDAVWQPTLDALLQAERLALDDRNKDLEAGDRLGLCGSGRITVTDPRPATLRFIDELALKRDTLWEQHRPSVQPEVLALQAPWPRGLPVQELLSIDIKARLSDRSLPFIQQRAKTLVFASRQDVQRPIPEDKETLAAIGRFVDDYGEALKIYLSWCSEQEAQDRTEAAWSHATTELSRDRLSPLQASKYWEPVFERAEARVPPSLLDYPQRSPPQLPDVDGEEGPMEWDPDGGQAFEVTKGRQLEPTCLDCLTTPVYGFGSTLDFVQPSPEISTFSLPKFWHIGQLGTSIAPDATEAYIAAALLKVDVLTKASSKLLCSPFPTGDVRFPALFLDSEFVESNQRIFRSFPQSLLGDTPPALLDQLTAALIAKLCAADDPSPQLVKWAFEMLQTLAWSDKPELAIRHIANVIVNLPQHSSWHRVLLHPGILKRLSAQQSKTLVAELFSAIGEDNKRREQAKTTAGDDEPDAEGNADPKPTKGSVKVTTVKLLAQLLQRAEYVDEELSIEVLVNLFKQSTHIDIRVAVVSSLIGFLSATKSTGIEETILTALETQVVPVAAQLSERSPMTEQDWIKAEETGEVPSDDDEVPIQNLIANFVNQSRRDSEKQRTYVQRLSLPLIRLSIEGCWRRTTAILRINEASDLVSIIPKALGMHSLLNTTLYHHPRYMPAALFQAYSELMVFFADPPKEVQQFSARLKATNPRSSSNRVWEMGTSMARAMAMDLVIPNRLMEAEFATSEEAAASDLLTPEQLQEHARKVIDIAINRFDNYAPKWDQFVPQYDPPCRHKQSKRLAWLRYCKPLVEHTLKRIESARTPEWQQDPQRRPSRLPDSFPQRLQLLSYPGMPWQSNSEQDLQSGKLARELHRLIKELAKSGRPYQTRFSLIVAAAKRCYDTHWAILAWQIGSLQAGQNERHFTLTELLHMELADSLLLGARKPKAKEDVSAVSNMLNQWRGCIDEDVRDRGITTMAALKDNAKTQRDALSL